MSQRLKDQLHMQYGFALSMKQGERPDFLFRLKEALSFVFYIWKQLRQGFALLMRLR